jgi:hypothetical protein
VVDGLAQVDCRDLGAGNVIDSAAMVGRADLEDLDAAMALVLDQSSEEDADRIGDVLPEMLGDHVDEPVDRLGVGPADESGALFLGQRWHRSRYYARSARPSEP